jgi:hypothetical protein
VPVDTGRLRNSLGINIHPDGSIRVGSNEKYALWVEEGTGIYGPHHSPIIPRHTHFLVFKPKGSSVYVFAKSVKGRPATPYLRPALLSNF